jgi:hypothetical protein
MAEIMKHVGKYGEKPCVVLFREVPNEPENCLIVVSSTLEDVQHDDFMNVVGSPEAQEANDLSTILERRQFSTGEGMLATLHYGKKIQKVAVAQVSLTPTPAQSVPLADVNAEIRKLEGGYTPSKTEQDPNLVGAEATQIPQEEELEKGDVAQNLIMQADLMEEDSKRLLNEAMLKREEAYALDPKLRKPGRPKKVQAIEEEADE